MNGLFGVGPLELILVGVLALIFIGPERLPGVIGQVMKTVRELRDYADQVRDELRTEFEPLRQDIEELSRDVNQFAGDLSQQVNDVANEAQQAADSARAPVPDLMAPPPPRDTTPALAAPTSVHTNGVTHTEEDAPSFADYRPQ